LRILLLSLVQLSPAIVAETEELQALVGIVHVTVVEIPQMAEETEVEETGVEVMTGAKGPEDVALSGPLLRPEVSGRPVLQACQVVLVEVNN
jgi:hypothetical protein